MSMTADLRDRWKAASIAGGSVFRDERPEGSGLPALRLQTVSDPWPSTYEGRQALRETTVQADCMASSRGEADAIAEAAVGVAETAGIHGDTIFSRTFVEGSRSYSERDEAGVRTFVTSLDLRVWHQPAA